MPGHLIERGKGIWRLCIEYPPDATGKRKRKYCTVRGGKREAERQLALKVAEAEETARPLRRPNAGPHDRN